MKKKDTTKLSINNMDIEWKLYQNLGKFVYFINSLRDGAAVRKEKLKSVPVTELPMIF